MFAKLIMYVIVKKWSSYVRFTAGRYHYRKLDGWSHTHAVRDAKARTVIDPKARTVIDPETRTDSGASANET